jgi:uncharacterized RDD family membrane protein YckC
MRIITPQNVAIDFAPASVVHRAAAALIDAVIMALLMLAFIQLVEIVQDIPVSLRVPVFLPLLVAIACYPMICEVLLSGKTIGKRFMRLRVIRLDGTRPTLESFFLRWLNSLIEVYGSFGILAFMMVVATRNYQRIGDIVAGTVVIYEPKPVSYSDVLLSIDDGATIQYAAARLLSDEEAETIRRLLSASRTTIDETRLRKLLWQAAEKLRGSMGVEYTNDPVVFLRNVLESHQAAHRNGRERV